MSTTKDERQKRRREVARRLRLGETYAEISGALGCSKSTVARDVQRIREDRMERLREDYDAHVAGALAELRAIKQEAFRAWTESRETKVKTKVRVKGEGRDAPAVTAEGEIEREAVVEDVEEIVREVTRTERTGDPRHLRAMLDAVREIIELLRLSEYEGTRTESRVAPLVEQIEKTRAQMFDTESDPET